MAWMLEGGAGRSRHPSRADGTPKHNNAGPPGFFFLAEPQDSENSQSAGGGLIYTPHDSPECTRWCCWIAGEEQVVAIGRALHGYA